jgi:DHA2 family methylenomycin A resistance protein-like MFS transporter
VFLQQVQGRSALTAGLWLLPVGVLTAACAPVAGRMMARAGARPPILAGLGAACLAFVALLRLDPGTSFPDVWWAFALLGVGTGLALPPMTATAVGAVRAQQAGMASAIHNASRQIGQTFAVAILGTILFARAGDAADQRRPTAAAAVDWAAGLHLALVVAGAALACVAVAIAVLLRRVPA